MRGDNAFEHWLMTCGQNPWEPLSPEAARPYRFIWLSWLRFLSGEQAEAIQPFAWARATPVQVLQFINHAPQSPKSHKPSDITRRRYWRVLDRVYDHAVLHQWARSNPAQGLAAQDIPPSENPQGAILSPRMWRALQQHIPQPDDLISSRDRAILMLLMELGLTPEEVKHLEVGNLRWSEDEPRVIQSLLVAGERDMQTRTLPVSPQLHHALQAWLQARGLPRHAGPERAVLHAQSPAADQPYPAASGHQNPAPGGVGRQAARACTHGPPGAAQHSAGAVAGVWLQRQRGAGTLWHEEPQCLAASACLLQQR